MNGKTMSKRSSRAWIGRLALAAFVGLGLGLTATAAQAQYGYRTYSRSLYGPSYYAVPSHSHHHHYSVARPYTRTVYPRVTYPRPVYPPVIVAPSIGYPRLTYPTPLYAPSVRYVTPYAYPTYPRVSVGISF
ncbi:MAG: hypothetical protein KDB14_32815 [Planctomycetales bacterium]|nr:hypothetical protein [Planctomycetales bacterium]